MNKYDVDEQKQSSLHKDNIERLENDFEHIRDFLESLKNNGKLFLRCKILRFLPAASQNEEKTD